MDRKMYHLTSECLQEVVVKKDEWGIDGSILINRVDLLKKQNNEQTKE